MRRNQEILITNSLERLNEAKDKLASKSISYRIRVVANDGSGFSFFAAFFDSSRRSHGSFGKNTAYSKTYYLYVSKDDFSLAKHLIS